MAAEKRQEAGQGEDEGGGFEGQEGGGAGPGPVEAGSGVLQQQVLNVAAKGDADEGKDEQCGALVCSEEGLDAGYLLTRCCESGVGGGGGGGGLFSVF